ncbi:MAG: galactose oxidase [Verrucomicrobia bacterium]|nr:galactose oxidase [Verrucomicrobiota bacterium]
MKAMFCLAILPRRGILPAKAYTRIQDGTQIDNGPFKTKLRSTLSLFQDRSSRREEALFPLKLEPPHVGCYGVLKSPPLNLRGIFCSVFLLCAADLSAASRFVWETLPSLPDREGFAGAFAGVSEGVLLVAGGANFPGKKPWEGGKKVWYDTVFALEKPDGQWKVVGRLPRPLGYGIPVSTKLGVVCIGGSDADRHYAETFMLALSNGVARMPRLPSLPVPLANAAGALLGETVLVCGGSDQPGERAALNRLFALDLLAATPTWKELDPCPGQPRILPVAAALDGAFYLVGGAALENTNGQISRVYLRDAWRYEPGRAWRRVADLPKPSVAAPSPAPVFGSRFFIVGGDDGSLVGFKPVERHPGFPKTLLVYDTLKNEWSQTGEVPAPRATLPAVWWRDRFVLPSGEVRPGVRSPEVWTFRLNP